jgi:bifunctional ADP-heptose synthase (sugar kinase/adenylyltransferase)
VALGIEEVKARALQLAQENGRDVFVTLSEQGIVGASPAGEAIHVPNLPLRGEIDIVGAGDAVTANLCAAQAAGATLEEAVTLANAAASVVIHKLGTTGTATIDEIHNLLFG